MQVKQAYKFCITLLLLSAQEIFGPISIFILCFNWLYTFYKIILYSFNLKTSVEVVSEGSKSCLTGS